VSFTSHPEQERSSGFAASGTKRSANRAAIESTRFVRSGTIGRHDFAPSPSTEASPPVVSFCSGQGAYGDGETFRKTALKRLSQRIDPISEFRFVWMARP